MRTTLHETKLRAVAEFARFCVRNPDLLGDKLIPQTLGVAIRKLHDYGESPLGSGKYLGHPCWSRKARSLLRRNSGTLDGIKKDLAHEHVIPVRVIVDELLAQPPRSTIRDLEKVIRQLSLVAIITRDEDTRLRKVKLTRAPNERWFESDPWWRYREAKLLHSIVGHSGARVDA